jgi:hypothetical protein
MGDRLAGVLGCAGQLKGLGAVDCQQGETPYSALYDIPVEAGGLPDGPLLVRVRLLSR